MSPASRGCPFVGLRVLSYFIKLHGIKLMQETLEHSDYFNEIKTRYGKIASEQALEVLCNEMLLHIKTLQSSLQYIQCLDISVTQNLLDEYSVIVDGLVKWINQVAKLRTETLSDNNSSPAEKLIALHYFIDMPVACIYNCAEFLLKETSGKPVPGLPEEYERWVADMREAANRIWDLFEVFTGVRIQD